MKSFVSPVLVTVLCGYLITISHAREDFDFNRLPSHVQRKICDGRMPNFLNIDKTISCCTGRTNNFGDGLSGDAINPTSIAAADIVTCWPGIIEPLKFRSYAGYVPVGQIMYHYHLFESQNNPLTDPFIIWFQGGPGGSGFQSSFGANGPFRVAPNVNSTADTGDLLLNPYSWNKNATLLYFDAPVGTGFSYSNDTSLYNYYDDTLTIQDDASIIRKVIDRHVWLRDLPVVIAGSSYGGHAAPGTAKYLLEQNDLDIVPKINITGIVLGNPFTDMFSYYTMRYLIYAGTGSITYDKWDAVYKSCIVPHIQDYSDGKINATAFKDIATMSINPACTAAVATANAAKDRPQGGFNAVYEDACTLAHQSRELNWYTTAMQRKTGSDADAVYMQGNDFVTINSEPDIQVINGVPFYFNELAHSPCSNTYLQNYFNRKSVQDNIHVDVNHLHPLANLIAPGTKGFIASNTAWLSNFARYKFADFAQDYTDVYRAVIDRIPMIVYDGTQDANVGTAANDLWRQYRLKLNIITPSTKWYRAAPFNDQSGGNLIRYERKFSHLTIKGGAHNACTLNPSLCYDMLMDFMAKKLN